jgi:hypothetical protein
LSDPPQGGPWPPDSRQFPPHSTDPLKEWRPGPPSSAGASSIKKRSLPSIYGGSALLSLPDTTAVSQSLDPSERGEPQEIQEVNPSDNRYKRIRSDLGPARPQEFDLHIGEETTKFPLEYIEGTNMLTRECGGRIYNSIRDNVEKVTTRMRNLINTIKRDLMKGDHTNVLQYAHEFSQERKIVKGIEEGATFFLRQGSKECDNFEVSNCY